MDGLPFTASSLWVLGSVNCLDYVLFLFLCVYLFGIKISFNLNGEYTLRNFGLYADEAGYSTGALQSGKRWFLFFAG